MSEKKLFSLPGFRCEEAFGKRIRGAAKYLDISLAKFIFDALVEKLDRMEQEYLALHSIFGEDSPEGNEHPVKPRSTYAYTIFDEEIEGE